MSRFHDDQPFAVNNAKYLALLLIFFGAILGVVYLCTDAFVVRKIVLSLLLPVGFCWLGLLTITYFLIVNNRKWLGLCCMALTLVFSMCGNGYVSHMLALSLESEYRDFDLESAPNYDVVVLLGGGTKAGVEGRGQLAASGDRVMVALQMYNQKKTTKIICTGNLKKSQRKTDLPTAGEQSKMVLLRAGIPAEHLELSEGRNTEEELANLAKKYNGTQTRIGIISSAWHLPRVMRLARAKNLRADPIPADFLAGEYRFQATSVVPSHAPMAANTVLIKELIAKAAGQ